jgi:hypothetical protein
MNILLLLQLFLLFFIGIFFTDKIGIKNSIEKIGLSFLLSTSIFTYLLFVQYELFGIYFTRNNILITLISLFLIFYFFVKKDKPFGNLKKDFNKIIVSKKGVLEKTIIFIMFLLFIFIFTQNYIWPVASWDALTLYDMRAIILSENGHFDKIINGGYFLGYPPYTSILHTISYLADFERVKIFYTILLFEFSLVFYSLMRRKNSKLISLLSSLVLVASPEILAHARMAYTNLPYSIYLSLGYIYLSYWILEKNKKDLLLGGLLIAFSTWVRGVEPFWIPSIFMIIIGLLINRKSFFLSLFIIFIIIYFKTPWNYFVMNVTNKEINGVFNSLNYINNFDLINLSKTFIEVLIYLKNILWSSNKLYFFPIIISMFPNLLYKKLDINALVFVQLLVFVLMIIFGTFIFTFQFNDWRLIGGSVARMTMFFIPLEIFIIFNSYFFKKSNIKRKRN